MASPEGRGTPLFQPGNTIGRATRFQPGVSGNPGGMPKTPPQYREAARRGACALMEQITKLIEEGSTPTADELAALQFLSDRAGLLRGQDVLSLEIQHLRSMLETVANDKLSPSQRDKVFASWERRVTAELPPKEEP